MRDANRIKRLLEQRGIIVEPVGGKVWLQASYDPDGTAVIMLVGVDDRVLMGGSS